MNLCEEPIYVTTESLVEALGRCREKMQLEDTAWIDFYGGLICIPIQKQINSNQNTLGVGGWQSGLMETQKLYEPTKGN